MTTQHDDLAEQLAEHAAATPYSAIAEGVFDHLARDLVDGLAACVGGLHASGVPAARAVIGEMARAGSAVVFGTDTRLTAPFAAMANATAGHALDFDDVLDEGGGMHAGVPVHCAALAVADELGGVSGAQYLGAVALGLDVAVRLALAPTDDYGWHRTSAYGIFGVTVAAGRLLGLDAEQMRNALGIAYSQASGNRQCIADGALSKRLQSGFGARDGITAVLLARHGLTGARRIFEGANGFFPLYQRGGYNRNVVLDGLGQEFLSARIALKPYPCGRNLHALVDAALAVRERITDREISRVHIDVAPRSAASLSRTYPTDVVQAQFSARFAVALALTQARLSIGDFAHCEEAPPAVRTVFDRTEIVPWPGSEGGNVRVTVTMSDGGSVSEVVAVARGNPARPLGSEELEAKFRDCNQASGSPLDPHAVHQVLDAARNIRGLTDTRQLTAALTAMTVPTL